MKFLVLTIVFVFTSLFLVGQNTRFKVEKLVCKKDFIVDPTLAQDHACYNLIYNTSNEKLSLYWKREDLMMPKEWEPSVCDSNACYGTSQTHCPIENPNILLPIDQMAIDVHIYDNGVFSSRGAHVRLTVFEKDDSTSYIVVNYVFNKDFVGTNQVQNIKISTYPNPAQDQLFVDYNTGIARIEIYNLMGAKILNYSTEPSKWYNISSLDNGVYLLKFITTENNILRTIKLIKEI